MQEGLEHHDRADGDRREHGIEKLQRLRGDFIGVLAATLWATVWVAIKLI